MQWKSLHEQDFTKHTDITKLDITNKKLLRAQ